MTDILVPFEQEGTKAVVRSWLKSVGERIEQHDPLVELETDKVTQEISSPCAGVLAEILLNADSEATPGAILGRIAESSEGDFIATARDPGAEQHVTGEHAVYLSSIRQPETDAVPLATAAAGALSPTVRRALRQHNVDPATIVGTGRAGRLTRADVDEAVARRAALPRSAEATNGLATAPPTRDAGAVQTIPHDRMRLAIAQNMLASVTIAPHVTSVFECDFSAIVAHRRKNKSAFEAQGAKLTLTAYFIAAVVQAMRAAPSINSRWFDDRLEMYDDVGVGIGTALGDKGLVVPVVQNAQSLSLVGIAKALTGLTDRAREGKLTPADMRGGTFTISNHGVSGSLLATPIIINQPQSAILGIGKLEKRVVVREVDGLDSIQIRPMCYVSLTIDHRVVDGHQTNSWLTKFVEVLERWPIDG